jgi:aspartyl-tRNA(Asn)/glutamyl-tRNA(Gln) amidotransferase subunit A
MCPLALGSDTGGSVRQPASFCGLVGFKPTYGRVSRYGLVAFGSSFDQIGPFATTVKDLSMMMEVIGRSCEKDSTSLDLPPLSFDFNAPVEGLRIGVPYGFIENISPEMHTLFDRSLKVLTDLGAKLVEVNLPLMKEGIAVYYVLATAEASTNLARFDGIRYGLRSSKAKTLEDVYELSREEGFGFEVKNRILLGTYLLSSTHQETYFRQAQRVRTLMIREVKTAFRSCDFIAMPTSPAAAFQIGHIGDSLNEYLQDLYTVPANATGLPAVSLPASLSSKGMPVGFQLMGPHCSDSELLQLAHAFEKAHPFPKRGESPA